MFVTVVLFFPDGVVGTAQKLMARFGGARAEVSAPQGPTPHPSPLPKGEREVAP
jgi:hypothetical protein